MALRTSGFRDPIRPKKPGEHKDAYRRRLLRERPKHINWRLLRAVRNRIAEHPETFYMGHWGNVLASFGEQFRRPRMRRGLPLCGTVGCIAGEALMVKGYKTNIIHVGDSIEFEGFVNPETGENTDIELEAAGLLNLNMYEWVHLFNGHWHTADVHDITARQTVRYLDRLLAGQVHLPRTSDEYHNIG